jgi:cyclophilin family peptidyl-prolyl cis-trans isomerase
MKKRPSQSLRRSRPARFEVLERRLVMAAPTLDAIPDVTVPAGASILVRLNGHDTDGDTLSFQPSSANASITANLMPATNRSLKMMVKGFGATPDVAQEMDLQLFENLSPLATAHIIELAQSGFYNHGTTADSPMTFHRVVKGFMIQGGDPKGDGTGGSTLGEFDDQFNPDLRFTSSGILAMAKSNDDTNDSQFFITGAAARSLDFNHTIFGYLTVGDGVRQDIENVPVEAQSSAAGAEVSKPTTSVVIQSVEVFTDISNGVLLIKAPKGASGTGQVTVTVDDGHGGTAVRTFTVTIAADLDGSNNPVSEPPYLLPIPDIHTAMNTAKSFTLGAADVNGSGVQFYSGITDDASLALSVTATDGSAVVTPSGGLVGIHAILVAVRTPSSDHTNDYSYYDDTQIAPIFIHPAAPTLSLSGGLFTKLNNSAAKKLTFHLTNLLKNTQVTLYADRTYNADGTVDNEGTVLAQVTATATTMDITTNGQATLAEGSHPIVAVQTLKDQVVPYGNRTGEKDDLPSAPGTVQLTVDTAAPHFTSTPGADAAVGQQYVYNAQGDETVSFSLPTKPAGMTVDGAGHVRWTPQPDQWPRQSAVLRITDRAGNYRNQSFTITVADTSQTFDPDPVIDLPADASGSLVTVLRSGDKIQVTNDRTGLLLFAQPVNRTLSMTIVGGSLADRLTVNFAAGGSFTLLDGLSFQGGAGADTLVVHGSTGADSVTVNGTTVTANGLRITPSGVEQLRLEGDAGENKFQLSASSIPVAVVAAGGTNTLDLSGATGGVTVNLALSGGQKQQIAPWHTTLAITGMVQNLTGTNFSDVLTGNAGNNIIRGLGGNDTIRGGGGKDALLGGDGNDALYAGSGDCMLIGGRGADGLHGSTGSDILIGGTTSYDANDQALMTILTQGAVKGVFGMTTRRFLGGSGSALKVGATVQDDGARDTLFGGGGHDWYVPGTKDVWRIG